MNNFNNLPESYWLDSTEKTNYPSLDKDMEVDVAIIGGGMAGITAGFILKRRGLKVAVLEVDRILEGTTAKTTAKITSQHGLFYDNLINNVGEEKARQYADANESAKEFIQSIIEEKGIDCDFSIMPAYVYTQDDSYVEKIKKEVEAASRLGIDASFVSDTHLPFPIKGAVRFENQAQFHPRKYLLELAKEIPGEGSHIFENTKVLDVKENTPNEVIIENGYTVKANKVIIASHYPMENLKGLYFSRIYTERAYIIGVLAEENFPEGMYINAESPTRSLRRQRYKDGQMILIAGENHKTGQGKSTEVHYNSLKQFAEDNFTIKDIPYRWSTQDCMTMDDIPFIGHITSNTKGIYVATGFKKWGMTNSTASAMILSDIITEGYSTHSEVFDPSRSDIKGGIGTFIKENLNVGYEFIKGKLNLEDNDTEITTGEGKVVDFKGKRVGFYRNTDGKTYIVDTTCTHLGCELQWNKAEKSWDCPCHGSRFSYDGKIIEGPALKELDVTIIED
ncbi:FAD-dependent oxidoreductase [Clostridium sp. D2Q-11]|uniref:FAD-dependent oxidoreductase n=1 Tax=Anaeromonas frigoriresistens TaxID=2683708 RepID=A0A942UW51_9FIRM|nr:FAD-dependent oxidoreductase [Anaeromonas frigoriresistens]MBS4539160.1 FAD-dependent oxidoreductase [Anaeromonas frigoriresistens]